MDCCVIDELLKKPFSRLTINEKKEVLRIGRPKPPLRLEIPMKLDGKGYKRHFNPNEYEKNEWLAGCGKLNKLFCFPTLQTSNFQN